ncbi:conserved hypothetical protein [Chlamydia pneumoniae LPCoLN]|uniref:hypothetical protein n=1 Tax=Chlamydia pneumoniae TaxID=83558 RepID=UPI0001BD9D48|nr:hypothetical protein [Chlamydia pneumoniae]ACZ32642.1 conserved hypothetical protein [Chlamydia pneumoniae LPCoLN]ETR79499.1 hypothetical protein X556_1180 [Chlamydia pneumoniae B21]
MATAHLGRQALLHLRSWTPAIRTSGNLFRQQSMSLHNNILFAGDIIGAIKNSTAISRYALGSSHHAHAALQKTEGFLGAADGVNTAVAGAMLWGQLLNGSMIFETDEETGELRRCNEADAEGCRTQKLQRRSALTITGKVARLASKTLGTATFLHEMDVVSLGANANKIGCKVTSCLNLVATGCSLTESSISLYRILSTRPETISDPENRNKPSAEFAARSKAIRNAFIAWLGDMVDLVCDALGTLSLFLPAILGVHAVLIMAILGLISCVINFVKDYAKIG